MTTELTTEEVLALCEHAPCGYLFTSMDGTVLSVNETLAKWLQCTKSDLHGKTNLKELLTAPSKLLYDTHYASSLQVLGTVDNIALDFVKKDGTLLPVMVKSTIRKDRGGKPSRIYSTLFDVTDHRRYERELLESKRKADKLADVVRNTDTAIVTVSFDMEIETWNDAAIRLFADEDLALTEGQTLNQLLPDECMDELQRCLETDGAAPEFFEHVFAGKVHCRLSASLLDDGIALFFVDITRDKASQIALQQAHDRFKLATKATSDGIFDWDYVADELYLSGRIQVILGQEDKQQKVSIREWAGQIHPKDVHAIEETVAEILTNKIERFENEYRVRHVDGSWRWVRSRGMPLYSTTGEFIRLIGSLMDITSAKFEDPLTRLHTRLSLLEHLERRLGEGRDHQGLCALLFIDLDAFKRINDSFGHKSGDVLLLEFARRLRNSLAKNPNNVAARLGGDEFVVLLDQVENEGEALLEANAIQELLQRPVLCGDHSLTLSASIGIVLSKASQATAEELLQNADVAMYRAKTSGKSQAKVFSEAMHREERSRLELEADLRKALANDELTVFYQPKFTLEAGKIIGFEALLRWDHPVRGMVPPDVFIGIAEESNLIREIGRWTLHQAIEQMAQWRAVGVVSSTASVSINLSPKQFGDTRLIEVLKEELARYELPPSCIELEVTEGVLIEDAAEALRLAKMLDSIGVGLVLDDFGKGYSSLSYLHKYPFRSLKVDRGFVSNLGLDGDGTTITRSIIALGQALKLDVIAEGIETEEHVRLLSEMGCLYGQGYLFCRPLPAAKIEAFLRQRNSAVRVPTAIRQPAPKQLSPVLLQSRSEHYGLRRVCS